MFPHPPEARADTRHRHEVGKGTWPSVFRAGARAAGHIGPSEAPNAEANRFSPFPEVRAVFPAPFLVAGASDSPRKGSESTGNRAFLGHF